MDIISLDFLYFVAGSLLIYYLLPGKLQNLFLLVISYYYYSTWSEELTDSRWTYLVILLALTVFNFLLAQAIERNKERKRLLVRVGVLLNLGLFLAFLFGGYIAPPLNELIEQVGLFRLAINLLIPLGFSYYIFNVVSYLVDVGRSQLKPSTNFINFALYLAYFPKIVSGPIERARVFLPQLEESKVVNHEVISRSVALIMLGLARSVLIAGIGVLLVPPNLFANLLAHSTPELLLGMVASGFILYFQFAGYTDVVRGVSGFYGIELSRNFAQPVFSKDFSDLWTRWHISLSFWLRDYIYLPLSRSFLRRNPSRTNKANIIIPPLATMLASGLWHGATPNLLLWGAMNAFYIIVETLLSLRRAATPSEKIPFFRRLRGMIVVASFAVASLVAFQLPLPDIKVFAFAILIIRDWSLPDFRVLLPIGAGIVLDWLQFTRGEFFFAAWRKWIQYLLFAIVFLGVIVVNEFQSALATFVYP